MSEKTLLEVGDRIYSTQYGQWSGPYTVSRVTVTRATAQYNSTGYEKTFQREIQRGEYVREIPKIKFGAAYYLPTPEREAEIIAGFEHRERVADLRNVDWRVADPDVVRWIHELYVELTGPDGEEKKEQTEEPEEG